MKLLQSGYPKSGNLWLYKILQEIIIRSGGDNSSFIEKQPIFDIAKHWELNYPEQNRIDVLEIMDYQYRYRISSIFNMPIDDIENYIQQTNHVWTHSPVCKRSGDVFNFFDKIVYIIRDPRDMAISASKYFTSPYMFKYFPQPITDPEKYLQTHFERLINEWLWHVYDHIRLSLEYNIHITFFEDFKNNFQLELEKLLNYLQIDLNSKAEKELETAVSFNTMKQQNPKHLNKGTTGQWIEKLPDDQVEQANLIAGPLLEFLGYPLHKSHIKKGTRELKNVDVKDLKRRILQNQEQLY